MSDSKQSANEELRNALRLCMRGMCGYCRMDAEARGMTTKCVNECEAVKIAKAALDRTDKLEWDRKREHRWMKNAARWIKCHDIYGHMGRELLDEAKELLNDDGEFLFKKGEIDNGNL